MDLERECFKISFKRPADFFLLSAEEQWAIDKKLGILDWAGTFMTEEDKIRFEKHYLSQKDIRKKKLEKLEKLPL